MAHRGPTTPAAETENDRALRDAHELHETTREICSRLDLDEVLHAIVHRAQRMLDGDVAYLATCDDTEQVLRMRAHANIESESFRTLVMPYDVGLGGAVAAQRRAMTTAEYTRDRQLRHEPGVDNAVRDEGLVSAVGAPVEYESRLLAVLFVAARRPHRFSPHDLTLLSSLANAAAIAINNAQIHGRLVTAMTIQHRLMDLALRGLGSQAVLETLAELIRGPATLVDWHGGVIHEAAFDGHHAPRANSLSPDARGANSPITKRIQVGDVLEAYLIAEPARDDPELGRLAVEQAATVFAIEFAKAKSADEAELRVRGGFVNELLAYPDGTDETALFRQAEQLGCRLTEPHVGALVGFRHGVSRVPSAQAWKRLLDIMRSSCRIAELGGLIADRNDSLALFIRVDTAAAAADLLHDGLSRCSAAGLPSVVAGVGSPTKTLDDYKDSLAEATRSLQHARSGDQQKPIIAYQELGFHQLVLGARPGDDVVKAARSTLAPVREYDQRRDGDLMRTLHLYLESNANAESTARRLRLHPNTLRARLARIEQILGRDLATATTRLDLHLALEALTLSGEQPGRR